MRSWESAAGTVAVIERDGERKLVFDNVFTLGGTHDARWEAMQTHVPLALHHRPWRVFFLGLGTGIITARLLGPHDRGLFALLLLLPQTLVAFAKMGVAQANVYHIRKRHVPIETVASSVSKMA